MYRTIVVGCDGSEHEADAIVLAQQLRDPQDGRLILVNAYSPSVGMAEATWALDYSRWLADQAAEDLERSEANVAFGVPCESRAVLASSPAAALNDVAEDAGADLIVLGGFHHGMTGDRPVRRTARRVIHGAPCAVAVSSPGQSARFTSAPSVAVAYDGSPESEAALTAAYAVAVATGARVRISLALEPVVFASGFSAGPGLGFEEERVAHGQATVEAAVARAPEGVEAEGHVLSGVPAQVIAADTADADLLVAGSRGFGVLHRVLVGSTSSGLLRDGRAPMLITPRVLLTAAARRENAVATAGASR